MAERYTRIFSQKNNLYTEGSPVIIEAGVLLSDELSDYLIAQVKFKNISHNTIKSVSISLVLFDKEDSDLNDNVFYKFSNLAATRDDSFGQNDAVKINNKSARSYKVDVEKVEFSDGGIWKSEADSAWDTIDLIQDELIRVYSDIELCKQYKIDISSSAEFQIKEVKDLWLCTCGRINNYTENECHICHATLRDLKNVDDEMLLKNKELRLEQERIHKEEEARQKEIKRQHQKKYIKIIIPIIILCIVIIVVYSKVIVPKVIIPSKNYNSALSYFENKEYEKAIEEFSSLEDYKDSNDKIYEVNYAWACQLLEDGKYEEAIEKYAELTDYQDSMNKILEAKYQWASNVYMNDQYEEAYNMFLDLADYEDSYTKACESYYMMGKEYLGNEEYDKAIEIFNDLGDFGDSKEQVALAENMICENMYVLANSLVEKEEFEEAKALYLELGNYKDSEELALKMDELREQYNQNILFSEALQLAKNGKIQKSYAKLQEITRDVEGKEELEKKVKAVLDSGFIGVWSPIPEETTPGAPSSGGKYYALEVYYDSGEFLFDFKLILEYNDGKYKTASGGFKIHYILEGDKLVETGSDSQQKEVFYKNGDKLIKHQDAGIYVGERTVTYSRVQ